MMIYLDNAATSPMSQPAIETLLQISQEVYANPSSLHSHGRKASQILRQSRQTIANLLAAQPNQITFTSGGSEANNLAIKGYALANKHKGKHLITTAIEHHSVLRTMEYLTQHHDFDLTVLQPQNGQILAEQLTDALRDDTILVSVMHANNETGMTLPIQEMGQILAEHQAVFHVDAVQTVGKLLVQPEQLGIDLLSASAHKFHGPKGVGFLYSKTYQLQAQILGGDQEHKRRAGTENLPAIAAMATALQDSLSNWQENLAQADQLRQTLLNELSDLDFYSNSSPDGLPYVINLGFTDQDNSLLLTQLDLAGVSVSSGSACTAGTIEPSHVLAALFGSQNKRLHENIRISLSKLTSLQDIQTFTQKLKMILGDNHGLHKSS